MGIYLSKFCRYLFPIILVLVIVAGLSQKTYAQEIHRVYPSSEEPIQRKEYTALKLGIFDPNSESDGLDGFSSDLFAGVLYGWRFTPNFAIEGELDYYQSSFGDQDLFVLPLVANLKLILPGGRVEPYLEGGGGLYYATFEFSSGVFIDRESAAGLGGHLGAGLDFRVTPEIDLGISFRWFYSKPDFSSAFGPDPNLGGYAFNFVLKAYTR